MRWPISFCAGGGSLVSLSFFLSTRVMSTCSIGQGPLMGNALAHLVVRWRGVFVVLVFFLLHKGHEHVQYRTGPIDCSELFSPCFFYLLHQGHECMQYRTGPTDCHEYMQYRTGPTDCLELSSPIWKSCQGSKFVDLSCSLFGILLSGVVWTEIET